MRQQPDQRRDDGEPMLPDARPADPMVSMIERIARDPNADLDKLERMLAMKERMDAQAAKVAFAHALSSARAEIPPITKDATVSYASKGGRTHYRHETLAGIAKTIDPALSRHGLSYGFRTDQGDGRVIVTCIISHRDGHCEQTTLSGSPDQSGSKNGFQAVGSAVTYLQRYTLKAALGLSAEVDDDGRAAVPTPDNRDTAQPQFNAIAAGKRIKARIENAATLDDLKSIWIDEQPAIQQIRAGNMDAFARLEVIKTTAKARLSGNGGNVAEPIANPPANPPADPRAEYLEDEIPY